MHAALIVHAKCISFLFNNNVNIRPWEKTQLARRLFEQHEGTQKHQTYGWGFGQTALMKYTTNKPIIEYSDLSISIRIQMA